MAKKQFKIGEYAVGGIIAVEINGNVIQIKALNYNSKEVVEVRSFISVERQAQWKLDSFLNDLTTTYYAGKVLEWIKTKVTFDHPYGL